MKSISNYFKKAKNEKEAERIIILFSQICAKVKKKPHYFQLLFV